MLTEYHEILSYHMTSRPHYSSFQPTSRIAYADGEKVYTNGWNHDDVSTILTLNTNNNNNNSCILTLSKNNNNDNNKSSILTLKKNNNNTKTMSILERTIERTKLLRQKDH